MFEFVWSLVYLAFAPVRYVKKGLGWLVAEQPPNVPLTRERPNILGPGVLDTLQASVFLLTDNNRQDGQPIGVGFCVGGKDKAVTAHHNLPSNSQVGSTIRGFFGPPHAGKFLNMEVTFASQQLDLAVLKINHSNSPFSSLQLCSDEPKPGNKVILAAFQISLAEQLQPDITNTNAIGVIPGALLKVHTRHLVYNCDSFSGDSGGALIFKDGVVIGMHTETVNQALERLRRSGSLSDRLDDVERSVDSMIRGLSSGSIGVKSTQFANLVQ